MQKKAKKPKLVFLPKFSAVQPIAGAVGQILAHNCMSSSPWGGRTGMKIFPCERRCCLQSLTFLNGLQLNQFHLSLYTLQQTQQQHNNINDQNDTKNIADIKNKKQIQLKNNTLRSLRKNIFVDVGGMKTSRVSRENNIQETMH